MVTIKKKLQRYLRFCPHCGSRFRTKSVHGQPELVCMSCGYTFWMNSKPTVSVLIIQKGKVLLIRRAIHPYKGYWDAPGGFLDVHEAPEQGMRREMREELNIKIIRPTLLGIYLGLYPSKPLQATFNVYFVATHYRGALRPQDDVASFAWHPLRRLPKKIAFANNRLALRDLQKSLKR